MKRVVILTCFIALALASSGRVYACDCVEYSLDAFTEFEKSEAVFIGRVIEAKEVKVPTGKSDGSFDYQMEVRLKVERGLKGIEGTEAILYTGSRCCECGFGFSENEKYLVYAYMFEGRLRTDYCTATKTFATAAKDLKEIAKGQKKRELRKLKERAALKAKPDMDSQRKE
jgi:predicted transcriptional regulator of viral defense system